MRSSAGPRPKKSLLDVLRDPSIRLLEDDEAEMIFGRIPGRWGVMFAYVEKGGRIPPVIDSLIAATALVHGLTVVTRNTADFERCGVTVVNPWETR